MLRFCPQRAGASHNSKPSLRGGQGRYFHMGLLNLSHWQWHFEVHAAEIEWYGCCFLVAASCAKVRVSGGSRRVWPSGVVDRPCRATRWTFVPLWPILCLWRALRGKIHLIVEALGLRRSFKAQARLALHALPRARLLGCPPGDVGRVHTAAHHVSTSLVATHPCLHDGVGSW